MNISIIGTGIYSISLALDAIDNNHFVTMWSESETLVDHYRKNHNLKPITDAKIPRSIKVTNSLSECLESADLIILATATKYIRNVLENIKKNFNITTPVCIASKGIEANDFLSDIVFKTLKAKHIAVISGPSFAIDLINKEPVALSIASTSKKATKAVINALGSNHLKLRANNDIYGTQICGCIKNTIAIAAGILDGLGYSESTRAFLITESIHDIKELLINLECNPKTIISYAGIGDLILTCSSSKSRNYQFGLLIGKKSKKDNLNKYLSKNTVEGYDTLLSIKELTKNRKIKIPIINIIYDIVINNKNPELLSEFLINKE